MKRVEWKNDLDKLKLAIWDYIFCLNKHYNRKEIKSNIIEVVNEELNDFYDFREGKTT